MRFVEILLSAATTVAASTAGSAFAAGDDPFAAELQSIQHEWANAVYRTPDKHARAAALEAVVEHASRFSDANPQRVEAVAWQGIVLSHYAGEVGALSAMKYAKAAREALERAERLDPDALEGGIYVTLGALYSKVPGGFIGFGDDRLADEYFHKSLAVAPDNLDNNYFYGEFLVDHGKYAEAVAVLEHALEAPPVANRPVFDAGRRGEVRALLEKARRKAG